MRRGELLKLCWSDVDFDTELITVQAMNSKTARARVIGMTSRVYSELRKLQDAAPSGHTGSVFGLTDFKRAWESVLGLAEIKAFDSTIFATQPEPG